MSSHSMKICSQFICQSAKFQRRKCRSSIIAPLASMQTCPSATITARGFSTNTENSSSQYKHGKHRSDAMERISRVPPIVVDGHLAVCDGGGGALGHPVEYIQLDTVSKDPQICKYCGLRYISAHRH